MNTWPSASPKPRRRVPVIEPGKAARAQELRAAEAAAAIRRLEPDVGQPLVVEEVHGRLGVLQLVAGARQVVSLVERLRDGRIDVGQRRRAPSALRPGRCAPARTTTSAGSTISRRSASSASAARCWRESGSRAAAPPRPRPARDRAAGSARRPRAPCSRAPAPAPAPATAAAPSTLASVALSVQYACLTAATVCTTASRNRSSELSWLRFAIVYCCRAASIVRSRSSGCENAELEARLQAGIEAADRVVRGGARRIPRHAPGAGAPRQPLPHAGGREPVVARRRRDRRAESSTAASRCSSARTRREHRRERAAALAHRAASTSVPSRTMARSGLFSTARRTASSSVSCSGSTAVPAPRAGAASAPAHSRGHRRTCRTHGHAACSFRRHPASDDVVPGLRGDGDRRALPRHAACRSTARRTA